MTERTLTCPELADKLTVEALVDCRHGAPEAMQVLVSKWRPPDRFDRFAAHDAGCTDGLDSTGYFGAVFDGRYVYFSPEMHGDSSTHGVVLRYDTHADFGSPASYAAHDASVTDGLDTRGFYGAVFDGRYVYFVPRQIGLMEYHSRVLRLDTNREFADPSSWSAFDVGEQHSQQSAAFDGRYIYFIPLSSGRVVRYDTRGGFDHQSSWQSFDARVDDCDLWLSVLANGSAAGQHRKQAQPENERFSLHGVWHTSIINCYPVVANYGRVGAYPRVDITMGHRAGSYGAIFVLFTPDRARIHREAE